MGEITGDSATRIWWTPAGGEPVEIPADGVEITMQWVEPERISFYNPPVLVFRGHDARVARVLWDWAKAVHLRRHRMHSAYGRRRRRGRW